MCIVVALMLTITSSQQVGSLTPQVKYMQPSNGSISCTISEPCTFDRYANSSEQHFLSDTTFIFLPGDHQLTTTLACMAFRMSHFKACQPTKDQLQSD